MGRAMANILTSPTYRAGRSIGLSCVLVKMLPMYSADIARYTNIFPDNPSFGGRYEIVLCDNLSYSDKTLRISSINPTLYKLSIIANWAFIETAK